MKHHQCAMKAAHFLLILSVLAIICAALVFLGVTEAIIGLAGTQWLLIAIALGVFATNLHLCKDCSRSDKCDG